MNIFLQETQNNSLDYHKDFYEETIFERDFSHIYTLLFFFFTLLPKQNLNELSAKYVVNDIKSKLHVVISLLCLISSLIFLPIIFLNLAVFGLLRLIIKTVLKFKYGHKFGGLLDGTDTIWAIEDKSKSIINALVVLKFKKNNPRKIRHTIKTTIYEKFFRNREMFPKLSSVRAKFFGYHFLIKNEFSISDCIKPLRIRNKKRIIDQRSLQKIISEYSNRDMPKNNSALWEVLVSTKPVAWNENQSRNQFPVLFRIHHSLGDGFSLIKLLLNSLADNSEPKTKTTETKDFWITVIKKLKLYCQNFCILMFAPATMMLQSIMRAKDDSILHGSQLEGQKIAAWLVEEKQELFETVQEIRQKLPGTRFSDVLLTAVSASFAEFYETNSDSVPQSVTAVLPAIINPSPNNLGNNSFSVGMLNLPVCLEINEENHDCRKSSLLERLNEVKTQSNLLRNSPDYKVTPVLSQLFSKWKFQVNYWLLKVISAAFPEPILKPILHSAYCTMIISNLPGCPKIPLFGGMIDDILFWVPHRGTTGLGVSVLTYDRRFQLGLYVDKALIYNHEQVKTILKNIFKYLALFKEEVDGN